MSRKALVVVDMQYMFHRHKYRIREEEEKRGGEPMLSYNEVETARLYFAMKDFCEILGFVKEHEADICVCLDSKSARKDENTEYKANRDKLQERDLEALKNIEMVLRNSGFAVIKEDGYEADDCIASVVNNRSSEYENVYVFTPDSDLCVLVRNNVHVKRYKSVYSKYGNKGRHLKFIDAHADVNEGNLSDYISAEYKAFIPYNAIALYKATAGDTSDHIPGIKGFGPKAFNNYVDALAMYDVDFEKMTSYEYVEDTLKRSVNLFGGNQSKVEEALASLELIKSRTCDSIEKQVLSFEFKMPDLESFYKQLSLFGITSLK